MRVTLASWLAVAALSLPAALPASGQVVYLQNDSFAGGPLLCYTGLTDVEALGAKFTAQPSQYPYTIQSVRVLGCGVPGGFDGYILDIFHDDGPGPNPGTSIYFGTAYVLFGDNAFNEIDLHLEPIPPITSGSVRVVLSSIHFATYIGFGADLGGILPTRNTLRSDFGVWSFAETEGVAGDWILRLGILANTPVELQSFVVE